MRMNSRGRVTVVVVAALAAVIVGGSAYALAGQSSSTLSACVRQHGGALYEARKCGQHDRRLVWSVAGPAGPQGAAGAAGPTGAAGPAGKNGVNGIDGTNGVGATTSPVALTLANGVDIAPLSSVSAVYGVCNQSSGSLISLVGIDASEAWQASGSYTTYQLQANGMAIVANGSATSAIGTYAIAATGSAPQAVAYTVLPTSSPALASGQMHVTIGAGASASDYEVTYNIETHPGATGSADLCTGEVTVVPTNQ